MMDKRKSLFKNHIFYEIWIDSSKMEKFNIRYFHRHWSFEKERDYNYKLCKYIFKWRFSIWLGWRVFHIVCPILFKTRIGYDSRTTP